jgi:hypothetical protein
MIRSVISKYVITIISGMIIPYIIIGVFLLPMSRNREKNELNNHKILAISLVIIACEICLFVSMVKYSLFIHAHLINQLIIAAVLETILYIFRFNKNNVGE